MDHLSKHKTQINSLKLSNSKLKQMVKNPASGSFLKVVNNTESKSDKDESHDEESANNLVEVE
jgi:hypothetical protein